MRTKSENKTPLLNYDENVTLNECLLNDIFHNFQAIKILNIMAICLRFICGFILVITKKLTDIVEHSTAMQVKRRPSNIIIPIANNIAPIISTTFLKC